MLLGLNNILAAYPDKSAEAICTFAYCEGPGKEVLLFQGKTKVCFVAHLLKMKGIHAKYGYVLVVGENSPSTGPGGFRMGRSV